MKKLVIWGLLIISAASLALMGFQCSSAEMTSAKLYIQRKEYQNAEAQLVKEVAKNPKNEEAWYLLGQVRVELKDYRGMKDAFVKAKEAGVKFKKEIESQTLAVWGRLFNDGVEYINKAEDAAGFDKAIEAFKLASYVMPESLANQQNLGLAYYRKGDYASAVEPLTVAFEQGKSVLACKILSGIYLQAADKAKMEYTEKNRDAMELKKNLDMIREKIKSADVKYYIGQPTSVKQETKGKGKNAKVVKEEWTYAPYNLVVTIEDDVVTKVTYTSPFTPAIDDSKLIEAKQEYGKAIEVLKKGIAMFPDDQDISESLMNAFIGAERNDEARALMLERVKKYPDSKFDHYNLGVFYLKENNFMDAVNEFKEVLRLEYVVLPGTTMDEVKKLYGEPKTSSEMVYDTMKTTGLVYDKATFYFVNGRIVGSTRTSENTSIGSSAIYNLAATYVNWGVTEQERIKKEGKEGDKSYQEKFKLAIPYLEKVATEKPNDVQIWELLGQVYANLGEGDKAKTAYEKADAIRQGKN